MSLRQDIFVTALKGLSYITQEAADSVKNNDELDGDEWEELDTALQATMEARNAYAQDGKVVIEDGYIQWDKSDAQKEEERVESESKEHERSGGDS